MNSSALLGLSLVILARPAAPPGAGTTPAAAVQQSPVLTRIHVELAAQPLERYALESDEIVRGLVTDQRTVFPADELPYTEVDLWVLSSVTGKKERMLQVRVCGASSPERTVEVLGAPRFFVGEEVLLFLMRYRDPVTKGEFYGIRGLEQGTYRLPSASDQPRAVRGLHAAGEPDLKTFEERVAKLRAQGLRAVTGGK